MNIPMSLLSMWHVASEGIPRYAMAGMRVEALTDGTVNVIATNGRVLMLAECDVVNEPPFRSGLIPRGLCQVAAQVGTLGTAEVRFSEDRRLATVDVPTDDGRIEMSASAQEGKFPEWRPVLEAAKAAAMETPGAQGGGAMHVKLGVRVFRELLASLEGMGMETVDLWLPAARPDLHANSILFRATRDDAEIRITGCLMPVAGGQPTVVIPPEPPEQLCSSSS